MALGAALVDKAYPVLKDLQAEKVEGTKIAVPRYGDRFRCRLDLPLGTESTWDGNKRRTKTPTMLFARRDVKGNLVALLGNQEVKIESVQYGVVTFLVQGDPKPLRRRRSIIGWECSLIKVTP